VEAARRLPTATLHEAGGKIGALPSAIKPVAPGMALAAVRVTVHSPGGDNLWLHRALDIAEPGDVMVVYTSGALRARLLGRDHGDDGAGAAAGRPGDRRLRARRRHCWRRWASRCSPAACASAAPARTSAPSAG
jgi:hypothetical protein